MNRLILIGNGFDLAHGLPTSYNSFFEWFLDNIISELPYNEFSFKHPLCSFKLHRSNIGLKGHLNYYFQGMPTKDIIHQLFHNKAGITFQCTTFFENIYLNYESKGWVDIENEYYKLLTINAEGNPAYYDEVNLLNTQLNFLQKKLIEYLNYVEDNYKITKNKFLESKIYSPIKAQDISNEGTKLFIDDIINKARKEDKFLEQKFNSYHNYRTFISNNLDAFRNNIMDKMIRDERYRDEVFRDELIPNILTLPDQIMLLSFNYTNTIECYKKDADIFDVNYIHGTLERPDSIIFGYGDESDEEYKKLKKTGYNKFLDNIKSIRYSESDNYRKVLSFLNSAPFQVFVFGHSCGSSDCTLLNTIFEHHNCISIKPYYHDKGNGTDNYLEIVQNISRIFNDMKLMRDRVVNKLYCEPLVQVKS